MQELTGQCNFSRDKANSLTKSILSPIYQCIDSTDTPSGNKATLEGRVQRSRASHTRQRSDTKLPPRRVSLANGPQRVKSCLLKNMQKWTFALMSDHY